MGLDDLKTAWQRPGEDAVDDGADRETAATIRARLLRIRRTVVFRDAAETLVALLVIFIFGRLFWIVRAPAARIGIALIIAGSILIITRLTLARGWNRRPKPPLNVKEFFLAESERIDAQIHLLQSVPWWYLGPVLLGTNLFAFGVSGPGAVSLIFLVSTVVLGWFLYRLNLRAVRERLVPVKNELARLLEELSENE